MKRWILFLILIILIVCIIVLSFYRFNADTKEHFALKYISPGNYAPANNCLEFVTTRDASGNGLGWNLGEDTWSFLSRAKILSLLVPGKDHLLQTKDIGQTFKGTCEIPPHVKDTIGVTDDCKLAGKHQLEKDSTGTCFMPLGDNQDQVMKYLDAAYEVYEAKDLEIIRDLEEQIRYYKQAKEKIDQQLPVVLEQQGKYDGLLGPLKFHNENLRRYNQNLRNCIKATTDAIRQNEKLLAVIKADIERSKRRINSIELMIKVYAPYSNQTLPPIPPPPPPPPPPPGVYTQCRTVNTGGQDPGRWRTEFMDRHPMACANNEMMQGFRMYSTGDAAATYEYTCCKLTSHPTDVPGFTSTNRETPWNDAGDWQVHYLDRHNVDCGNDYIQGIHVIPDKKNGKIRINYTCNRPEDLIANCNDYSTEWQVTNPHTEKRAGNLWAIGAVGGIGGLAVAGFTKLALDNKARNAHKSWKYLDRHNVRCPDGEGLTRVQLESKDSGQFIKYNYRCCKPERGPHMPRRQFTAIVWYSMQLKKVKYGNAAEFTCPVPLKNVKDVDYFAEVKPGEVVIAEAKAEQAAAAKKK